ncbi:MAG: zinc ABC transporter substrate-binding protein [Rhodospirillaceae bacterium]|nr:zinc ABC transporter substrate-binding protein [Rhodospirillaceae bacterium]
MNRPKSWNARVGTAALVVPALVLAAAGATARAEAPRVVATIKPIHALVASVMDGIGTPALLLKGSISPHGVSLRPSQARLLSEAGVVVWTGPALEQSVAKIVKNLAGKAISVPLQDAKGVRLYKLREGGLWEGHDDDHGHMDDGHKDHDDDHKDEAGKGHDDHDGERADIDAHIWLDPHNAIAMTRAIAGALARADAANAAAYRANAAATITRLKALDDGIAKALRPVRKKRYIVFHDAYQYFEKRYRLTPAGSITVDPHRAPSPRRLYEIRSHILARRASCVFREPQFTPKIVNVLVRGTSARVGTLDPVGAALPAGKGAYEILLNRLVANLRACLTG